MDIIFKVKKKRDKFILSVLSAIAYLLGYSIIMESGNFSVYFISYIHYKQKWVNMQYGNLMRPVVLLFLSLFSPLSGTMENLIGPRFALLTSAIVIEIVLIFFYFQRNLWIFYILSLFLGLGCGLSANITVKNCCLYYPKKKGFISACIMSLGALVGSSYTLIGEKIINPEREKVVDIVDDPYYSEEIALRSKYFFLFGMIIFPIATAISLFLFYRYDPNCEIDDEIKKLLLEGNSEEKKENEKDKQKTENEKEEGNENEVIRETKNGENKESEKIISSNSLTKSSQKGNVKKALKDFRFWRNIIISGIMPLGLYFVFATNRAYCSLLGVDGDVVGTLAGTMNIIGSLCNPIWAFYTDKFGFQPVMKIIYFFIIIVTIYFVIFMKSQVFYVIGLYISCVFRGGVLSCITPHIMHIYGLKYYLTLGGYGKLFNQLSSFLIAMISIIISIFKKTKDELATPYRIICSIGVVFSIVGFILVYFENDEKFKFDDDEEEEKDVQKLEKQPKENNEEKNENKNIDNNDEKNKVNEDKDKDNNKEEKEEKDENLNEAKENNKNIEDMPNEIQPDIEKDE